MKYSKSAIGLLTAQYRSVLKKCWLINVGLFALGAAVATPANAANNVVVGGTYESSAGTVTGGTVTDLDTVYDAKDAAAAVDAKLGGSFSSTNTVADAFEQLNSMVIPSLATVADTRVTAGTYNNITAGTGVGANLVSLNNAIDSVVNKLDDGASGYDIDAKTLKVGGTTVATTSDIANMVTTTTIANGSINTFQAGTDDDKKVVINGTAGTISIGSNTVATTADIAALDANVSQSASTTNPLALNITQADGVITGVSGSVAIDGTSIVVNSEGKLDIGSVDVADISTTNYASSALKTAVVGTKVDAASSADSAKAVTSDAISTDGTLVLDSGKLKVGTIAQSQVSGLTDALDAKQAKLTSTSGNAGNGVSITDAGVISAKAGNTTITVDGDGIKVGTIAQSQVDGLATALAGKINTSDIATTLSTTSTDSQVASAKVVYDGLAGKINTSDIATTLSVTSTDSQVASAKAVYDGLATKVNTANLADKSLNINAASLKVNDVDVVTTSGTQTLTNKTIDADSNTISNIETDNFKSGVIQTTVRAAASASDTALASEKAVATALDAKVNNDGNFTAATDSDLIKNKTVVAAIKDTAAAVDVNATKNTTQDTALTNLYTAVNGGTYNPTTGAVDTPTTLASGFSAGNLTAAANELLGDITVTSGQVTTTNHLTAGANLAGNVVAVANSLASTEALVGTGSAPKAGTGILAGKTITGTAGTNNLNLVDAVSYVAANGAGLNVNNIYTGTNTFGETSGAQVIIDNGGNLTANTSLKVGTSTTNMLTVSSTGTTIGAANAIVGTAGNLDMGGNSLSNVHGLTLTDGTGHTNDATISVDANGINTGNKTLDVGTGALKSETLYVGTTDQFSVNGAGNVSTSGTLSVAGGNFTVDADGAVSAADGAFSVDKDGKTVVATLDIGTTGKGFDANGNLTAGTISATGIDTTTANTVNLGGTGFTTAVTGDMTVSGDTALGGDLDVDGDLTVDGTATLNDVDVAGDLTVAGDTTLADTKVAGDLEVTGAATFGDTTDKFVDITDGAITVHDGTGSANVTASIANNGNITTKGTLDVAGLASLDGGLNVNDVFDVNATTGAVTLTNGTNTATLAMTDIKVADPDDPSNPESITNVMKVTGTGLFTGDVASEKGFVVAQKNGIDQYEVKYSVDQNGNIESKGTLSVSDGKFTVDGDGAVKAADGKFTVDKDGAIVAANGGFTVAKDGKTIVGNDFKVTDRFTVEGATGNTVVGGNLAVRDKFTVDADTGNTAVAGTFSAAAAKFTIDDDGAVKAANGNFTVSKEGNTAVAGTMDIEGNTTIGDKFSVKAEDGSMSAAGGNFTVDANGAVSAANGEFTVDKNGNTTVKGQFGAGANGTEFQVGSTGSVYVGIDKFTVNANDGSVSAASGEFKVDGNGNTTIKGTLGAGANGTEFQVGSTGNVYAQALAFNSDHSKMVNAIDQGTAITDGVADTDARKETMATTATVAKTIGNLAAKNAHGVTDVSDVASAIDTLSQNVETATGGTFAGATWTGTITTGATDYTYGATAGYHDIMSAVSQVASNVGAATTVTFNNVAADNTVNANIDALNKKVGDMNTIGYGYKNLSNGTTTQPETVVEALQNIDASMGTIHGLANKLKSEGKYQGNLAEGTTVENHLTALDTAIGDRSRFNNMHYTKGAKSVVDAVGKLDNKLSGLDHDVRTLRHKFQSGMASAAALSALVPNARAHGDTQLSLGTGMYHGHGAMAIGGFHWFSDNLLFNTGIAWDDNEATYRMGVTYSW